MSQSLEETLGIDLTDPSHRLAQALVEGDARLLNELREARKRARISQKRLAEMIGCNLAAVTQFEQYDSDPSLSFLRRYAHALGLMVDHQTWTWRQFIDEEGTAER
jgi:transcriptional regulator with XRE-family HTH domain